MKRLSVLLAISFVLVAVMASPAFGATLRLSASAKQRAVHKVVFTAKLSRSARVRVTVYRGGQALKSLGTKKSGSTYTASWSGSSVAAGTYSYKVTATASSKSRTTRGTVKVKVPTVVPVVPVVTTPPVAGSGRWLGLWVPGSPSSMAPLEAAESLAGTHAGVVHFFISDSESFPAARCQSVADHGSTPLVTLEFWSIGSTGLTAITNGSKDAYITKFADAAKAYGGEVWLRPFHEMNGNWYPWGGSVGSNSASKLVAAWKHVHDIFVAEGATNVKFVWCVNNDSVPSGSANAISAYWPGDAYVDYAAMDGYNAGTTQSWSSWRPFTNVFGAAYSTVAGLTSKPIFIAETSSVEQGGSKAAWVTDMFSSIASKFPRLIGVCWFDELKTYDWRIESSTASADAFRTSLAAGF
jgi:hypothetical protein